MSKRQAQFQKLLDAARAQSSRWLCSCHKNPGGAQSALSRAAVRKVLRERGHHITLLAINSAT